MGCLHDRNNHVITKDAFRYMVCSVPGFRIQDFFIFNTTQHNEHIKSTTQFNKGVRNKPTILAKMKIGKLTKTRCLCYLTHYAAVLN